MKKFFLVSAILFAFAIQSKAQHTYPRYPYDGHTLSNGSQFDYKVINASIPSDTTYGDTLWFSPNASNTVLSINNNDTLHGSIHIDLANKTRRGVTYSKSNCYKYDMLTVLFKPAPVNADTIFFSGAIAYAASTNYIVVSPAASATQKRIDFWFDGTNFVPYVSPNSITAVSVSQTIILADSARTASVLINGVSYNILLKKN